jgi:two-component system phosphate regulon sensor histidine kinase PhoR
MHMVNIAATRTRLRSEHDALLENCGAAVLVIDPDDVVESANPMAFRSFRVPEKILTGVPLAPPLFPTAFTDLVARARTTGATQRAEVVWPDPDGRSLAVSIAPIGRGKRKRRRLLLIAQDVSELRRLETVRRDFVANVSHELRTPLASIRAMAETLQDGAMQDEAVADRFLGTIINEAERLTRISQDLLILSDSESRSPEKAPFSLSSLLEDVVKRFQPQALKAGITLTADVPLGVWVDASSDQLEAVVVNLVDNSLKYTLEGGTVLVSVEHTPGTIIVRVTDTGIGIAKKHHSRLFERFYRVDKARSRQSGGTGLGLSIVKHIVEAHGGQVTVDSEPEKGSTFAFTLPAGG